MCSPKEYVFQETKKFVSVIWQQFHGLCEHKNSHLEGKVQYSFVVIAKIDVLLCTVGLSAQGGTQRRLQEDQGDEMCDDQSVHIQAGCT